MSDETAFSLERITGSFSKSEDVVLSETATTCLVFRPRVHGGGIRGELIRFKKDGKDLVEPDHVDFRKLKTNEGLHIELDTKAVARFVERVSELAEANSQLDHWRDRQEFKVAPADMVIDAGNKGGVIRKLLEGGYSDDFWEELVDTEPDLATRLAWAKIYGEYEAAVAEFEASLNTHPDDEAYWQDFFERNPWILQQAFAYPVLLLEGDVYVGGKKAKGRQGQGGVATDFLFANESSRSFALVEIKVPDTKLVASLYRGTEGREASNEVYSMSTKLTGALVQTQTQIKVAVSQFGLVLKETFGDQLNATHPHGILIAGSLASLEPAERDSFNHFRFGVKDVTILTYDELLRRIQLILQHSTPEPTETAPDDWPF